ncbi:replication-associated recombination protein A [Mycoplasma nasistruthionis]|uniref:Replication-associated recombination protein A n=1 Tax=Mycoplasma nasistruthionis TaxID=353852 RepID=A0A5B7XVV4_9MOLU|nr:replication-associated recombination protein A [Mycoplasma nasistruthionis]QCZ36585.1 replication-associated recombination protein A [Mycoplasma nasistruthionis]
MNNRNLANQLRPTTLDDIVGQSHVIKLLKEVVKNKITTSFLFFGDAGTGKTSAAIALANDLGLSYGYFNASVDSKAQLTELLGSKEVIIIDEIHRLNKDKQEILLSYLEFDKIIVYATTTQNPYFKVDPAVRSRMQIKEFLKISEADIVDKLQKVAKQHFPHLKLDKEILLSLAKYSAGDLRTSLNNLQMLGLIKKDDSKVSKQDLKDLIPNINFYSDQNSSAHYNNLSAFHKSLRGSDVDAALYYGFLILKSGDVDGLFRRMLCVAYEDVGLASPNIGLRTLNAIETFERLGLPEGKLPIGVAIADLALAPKSNSVYLAIEKANSLIDQGMIYDIPKHLKDAHYKSASKLGHGVDYLYPHDFLNNWIDQQYLPNKLQDTKFYYPGLNDAEQKIKTYWQKVKTKEQ